MRFAILVSAAGVLAWASPAAAKTKGELKNVHMRCGGAPRRWPPSLSADGSEWKAAGARRAVPEATSPRQARTSHCPLVDSVPLSEVNNGSGTREK